MDPQSKEKDWTHTLFVEHPELFLPVLESLKPRSPFEAHRLSRIFDEFKIPRGARILDFSCGIGRHSVNLVKNGYRVVGYDPSAFYIQKAKDWANQEGQVDDLRFYHGRVEKAVEVLSKNDETEFDAIIIMFNSLGYMGETADVEILNDIFELGASKCILVTETDNRDWWIRNFQPYVTFEFEELEIHDQWKFNLETSVAESRSKFYRKNSDNKNLRLLLDLHTSQRLYSLHELIKVIKGAGWKYLRNQGGIETAEPASYEKLNILTISQKE